MSVLPLGAVWIHNREDWKEGSMSAVDHRHWALVAAIMTAVLLPSRAASQALDDPARGPFDERVRLPTTAWNLPPGDSLEWPNPAVAGSLSAGVTVGGALALAAGAAGGNDQLTLAGLLGLGLGPSMGHWYSGEAWNPGLTARVGGALVSGAGLILALGCVDGDTTEPCSFGSDMFLTGTVAYVASTVYEIVTAPRSARRFNRRARDARLVVAPMRGQDQVVPGLALAARF
jgi:hypothetical protein